MVSYVSVWREFRQMIRATRIGLLWKICKLSEVKCDKRWRKVQTHFARLFPYFASGLQVPP